MFFRSRPYYVLIVNDQRIYCSVSNATSRIFFLFRILRLEFKRFCRLKKQQQQQQHKQLYEKLFLKFRAISLLLVYRSKDVPDYFFFNSCVPVMQKTMLASSSNFPPQYRNLEFGNHLHVQLSDISVSARGFSRHHFNANRFPVFQRWQTSFYFIFNYKT